MILIILRVLTLVFALIGSGCSLLEDLLTPNRVPTLKAHPERSVRLSGQIDPGLRLELTALYATSRESCNKTVNFFEGASFPRTVLYESHVEVTEGRYEATIPLDQVEPGWCGWRIWSIQYTMAKGEVSQGVPIAPTPLVWFSPEYPDHTSQITIECHQREESPPTGRVHLWCDRRSRGTSRAGLETREIVVDFREVARPARARGCPVCGPALQDPAWQGEAGP